MAAGRAQGWARWGGVRGIYLFCFCFCHLTDCPARAERGQRRFQRSRHLGVGAGAVDAGGGRGGVTSSQTVTFKSSKHLFTSHTLLYSFKLAFKTFHQKLK